MSPVPEITDEENAAARRRSPDEATRLEESRERMRVARRAYGHAFTSMRPVLAAVGYDVDSAGDLLRQYQTSSVPYRAAVPVLARWLDRADYPPLRADIVSALSVPWAKPEATQPLLRMFASGPENLRWAVGNAIEQIADPTAIDDIMGLVGNPDYGQAREPLLRVLGKLKARQAIPLLIDLLHDPAIRHTTVGVLGQLKATAARERLVELGKRSDGEMRKLIERALKRIG